MSEMKKYVTICLAALMAAACKRSYPGLYAPIVDPDNPNPEVTVDRIPITVSLTDPAYALVTGATTRGNGPFGFWDNEEDRSHWLEAEFGIYAFLTRNHVYDGTANLAATETDGSSGVPMCLVDDRKAHLSPACELVWDDPEPPYYATDYPEHKYNFFLYHTDDAVEYAPEVRTQSRIVKCIQVDGTQDVLSAYARPDMEDAERLGDSDEAKYLMNHAGDLVYSYLSGRQRVEPHFRVSHEMSRVDFSVRTPVDEPLGEGREVRIMAVGVVVPVRGEFTVAADWRGVSTDWNDEGNVPMTGIVWSEDEADKDTVFVPTDDTPDTFGSTYVEENARFSPEVPVSDAEPGPAALGKSLLLPAVDRAKFYLAYRFMATNEEEAFLNNTLFESMTEMAVNFKPGYRHEVVLYVYGPRRIAIEIDGQGLGWLDGGNIEIDSDEK